MQSNNPYSNLTPSVQQHLHHANSTVQIGGKGTVRRRRLRKSNSLLNSQEFLNNSESLHSFLKKFSFNDCGKLEGGVTFIYDDGTLATYDSVNLNANTKHNFYHFNLSQYATNRKRSKTKLTELNANQAPKMVKIDRAEDLVLNPDNYEKVLELAGVDGHDYLSSLINLNQFEPSITQQLLSREFKSNRPEYQKNNLISHQQNEFKETQEEDDNLNVNSLGNSGTSINLSNSEGFKSASNLSYLTTNDLISNLSFSGNSKLVESENSLMKNSSEPNLESKTSDKSKKKQSSSAKKPKKVTISAHELNLNEKLPSNHQSTSGENKPPISGSTSLLFINNNSSSKNVPSSSIDSGIDNQNLVNKSKKNKIRSAKSLDETLIENDIKPSSSSYKSHTKTSDDAKDLRSMAFLRSNPYPKKEKKSKKLKGTNNKAPLQKTQSLNDEANSSRSINITENKEKSKSMSSMKSLEIIDEVDNANNDADDESKTNLNSSTMQTLSDKRFVQNTIKLSTTPVNRIKTKSKKKSNEKEEQNKLNGM
jgi:hypothetical protein